MAHPLATTPSVCPLSVTSSQAIPHESPSVVKSRAISALFRSVLKFPSNILKIVLITN